MKFLIHVIATAFACFMLQYLLPWWTMAIGAFAVAYFIGKKGFSSFLAGFVAIGMLWFVMAFTIDAITHSGLAQKISQLLPLNAFLMTALIGGLIGGFAALSGSMLKSTK